MAAGSGNDFDLKIGDGGGSEVFTAIASCRSTSMTLNNAPVDITTKDSAHWRTLLSAGGQKSISLSIDGVFADGATEETLRAKAFANVLWNYELAFPNGDKIAGAFLITNYGRTGNYDDAEMFSCSLESSGAITFTAG